MSFEELRQQYRAQERWLDLAVLLEQRRKSGVSHDRGALNQEFLELLEYMVAATDGESRRFAESRLEGMYREVGDARALEALAGYYLDQSERHQTDLVRYVSLRRKCAQVFEQELGRPESALLVLTSALGSDVLSSPEVLGDLERLARATGDWESVLEAVAPILVQLESDERIQPLLVTLGRWCLVELGDEQQGVRLLERALEFDSNDLVAIDLLERHCRKKGDYAALAEILRFRADAGTDGSSRAAAWLQIAELAQGPLDQPQLLIESLQRALELSDDPGVRRRLEAAYRDGERWEDLAAMLRGMLAQARDPAEKKAINQRLAEVLARIGAIEDAIREYRAAAPDARSFVQVLKREAERANEGNRARLLAEIGHVYSREMKDTLASHHFYEQALSLDSQVVDAAEPMADIYLSEKAWDKAAPLLESLLRRGRLTRDPAWLHRRYVQYGQCCDRLGKRGPALQAFREAYEINPRDTATVKGLGKLLFESGEWDQAVRIFGVLLKDHVGRMPPAEVAGLNYMAARSFQEMGDEGRAIAAYQKVVELNPRHREALRALVDIFDRRQSWANLIQYADMLVVVEPEPLVRFRQLSKVGEVWATQLNRPDLAMVAYKAALDIDPNSIVVLRKLLDLYTRTEKYPLAVKVLERLIQGESQPKRRATLHYTAGVLCRDRVGNEAEALEHFEAALDDDLDMIKAFEAIDRILTGQRDWKSLERAYRRMLKRVTPSDTDELRRIEILLWEGLGEIYRSRLGQFELAVDAYKVLETLAPHEEKYRRILAELYARTGDSEGAVQEHRRLIAEDPVRVESYHVLFDAFLKQGRFDAAWCVAGALSYLKSSRADEESYYQKYLGRNLRLGKGLVTHEMNAQLHHGRHDAVVGALLSYAAEGLRGIYGVPLKARGLDAKRDLVPGEARSVFRQIWQYVGQILGVTVLPELFVVGEPGLFNLNAEMPAAGVGPDRRESSNDRENAFYAAKLLVGMRPENYLGTVFPPEALQSMLMAVLESVDPGFGYSKQLRDPNFDRAVKELKKLPEAARAPLRALVGRFKQRGGNANVAEWVNGLELTSNRAGLLLCGDLGVAAHCVRYGGMQFGAVPGEERMRDLLLFSTSEPYFALRAHLGLSIGGHSPF